MTSRTHVTELLHDWSNGDQAALEHLIPLIYSELRRVAGNYLRGERADHTLQPTALVHEAYLRLVDQKSMHWQNRAHFFGAAAQIMRRILVDYARAHLTAKRGGGESILTLDEIIALPERRDVNLLALDEALKRLEEIDPQKSRLIELRFFTGLTIEEVSEVMGVSVPTLTRQWRTAKAWLHRELSDETQNDPATMAEG